VFLIISGCISSGSGNNSCDDLSDEFGLRLTTRVIFRDSKASLEVMCTNVGHEAMNVTRFLPWGFNNPAISVTDPKGIVYDAMDIRNITPTIRAKPLDSGDSVSITYDLLGFWKKGDEATRVSGKEVFSKAGEYTLNVRYSPFMYVMSSPFMQDLDPGKAQIVLVCEIRFKPPARLAKK